MPKTNVSSSVGVPLFGTPVPIPVKRPHRTLLVHVFRDPDSNLVVEHVDVDKLLSESVELSFHEVTLSNLIEKGVVPHSLSIIDTNKIGVDSGVDALANHLINNADSYVERGNSYNKSEK